MNSRPQENFPDYRYTLANERTFLAWIRTALAFLAAAVGLDQLAVSIAPAFLKPVLVLILCFTAAYLSYYAWYRWAGNEKSIQQSAALPYPFLLVWLSRGFTLFVIVIITLLVFI